MGKTISFDEWIEASHYRNFQTRKLTNQDDVAKAISLIDELKVFVGLAENFDESLVMMTKVYSANARFSVFSPTGYFKILRQQ